MRPLIINKAVQQRIDSLVAYAEANRIPLKEMKLHANGKLPAVGDNACRVFVVPKGFRCVYSIEHHPGGLYRHLSVSVPEKGRAPNMLAMGMLAGAFGFVQGTPGRIFNTEQLPDGRVAINVLEPYVPSKNN